MLDDAERDVRRERALSNGERAQVHACERHRRDAPALDECVHAPVGAQRAPAPLAQQHHVLAGTAAGLEDYARRGRQRTRDQVGQRRRPREREKLAYRVLSPVLRPELLPGGDGVVSDHLPSDISATISR